MKNLIIFAILIITFNACSVTSHHKVNSNLEFEEVSKEKRKTYLLFAEERLIKTIQNETLEEEDSFADEFAEKKKMIKTRLNLTID